MIEQWIAKITAISYTGFMGLLGGLITLLYKYGKGEEFRWHIWLSSLALAFLLARLAWEFMPEDMKYRDWVLGVVWLCSYTIVQFFDIYGVKIAKALFEKKIQYKNRRTKRVVYILFFIFYFLLRWTEKLFQLQVL
jgi:hypothetical protein